MVTQQSVLPAWVLRRRASADDEIAIVRADAGIVALFFALDTQWHRHPFTGQRTGIDYAAIRPTAELADIEIDRNTLPGLRVMEQAALTTFAEALK